MCSAFRESIVINAGQSLGKRFGRKSMAIKKIISAGQTEGDQAALDAARELGIPYGGVPGGIEQNVIDSDGNLIISYGFLVLNTALTLKYAILNEKESLNIDLNRARGFAATSLIKSWIVMNDIEVLNVTGPPAEESPYVYEDTVRLLKGVNQLFFIESKKSEVDRLKPLNPRTVEDAIDRLMSELPLKNKSHIAKLEAHELELLHPTLGIHIVDNYGLRFKKGELMKDCRFMAKGKDLDENEAAALIIRKLWESLRKTHAMRVVK